MTGSHRDEIAKLEALYSANPEGRIFTHLAEAYRKAGDLAQARATIERGLERHGDYSSAHVVRGRILIDQGERGEAERAFQRVLVLDPENRIALWTLGDLAREAGRTAEALGFYQELLLLDPTDEAADALVRSLDYELSAAEAGPAVQPDAVLQEAPGTPAVDEPVVEEVFEFMPLAEEAVTLEPMDLELGGMEVGSFDPFDLGSAMLDLEGAALEASPTPVDPEPATPDVGPDLLDLDALAEEPTPALLDLDEALFDLGHPDTESVEFGQTESEPAELEPVELGPAELEPVELEPAELDEDVALVDALSEGDLYGFEEFTSEFGDPAVEGSELPWGGDDLSGGWEDEDEPALAPEDEAPLVGAAFDWAEPEGTAWPSGEDEVLGEEEVLGEGEAPTAEPALEVAASVGAHEVGPVVTETLAELYASQGLYDRATDIYRELLRVRPGDPRLASRLEALEGEAQPAEDAPEQVVGERSGRSIGEYLSGLLAFVGTAPVAGVPEADVPAAEPSHSDRAPVGALPGLDPLQEEAPPAPDIAPADAALVAETAPMEEIPVAGLSVLEAHPTEAEPAADAVLYLDDAMVVEEGRVESDIFFLDESMVVEEEGAESDVLILDESMVVAGPAGAAGDEFDRLFAGQGEVEGAAPASPSVSAAGVDEADDDDLEMFRSWLQNLKRS
jgi:tetratricopeptide (TPR) repeat protein